MKNCITIRRRHRSTSRVRQGNLSFLEINHREPCILVLPFFLRVCCCWNRHDARHKAQRMGIELRKDPFSESVHQTDRRTLKGSVLATPSTVPTNIGVRQIKSIPGIPCHSPRFPHPTSKMQVHTYRHELEPVKIEAKSVNSI